MRSIKYRDLGCAAFIAGVVAGATYLALRPRLLRLGASDGEVTRDMPSDEVVPHPNYVTNRAVSLEAPPADVWPWLAQLGESPRGGFYSYVWVERLMGMRVANADRILPEYQHPKVGDVLDGRGTMTVLGVHDGHWIALGPPESANLWLSTVWTLAICADGPGRARLVSRVRAHVKRWSPSSALIMAMMEPGQLIMELKMFAEIKKRAERVST
jgi:hypothetical protein